MVSSATWWLELLGREVRSSPSTTTRKMSISEHISEIVCTTHWMVSIPPRIRLPACDQTGCTRDDRRSTRLD